MAKSKSSSVSVLMPAFNEEKTILLVLQKLIALPFVKEIIVVDDCSTDQTWNLVEKFSKKSSKVKLHSHEKNQGKTGAIATALSHATGDITVVQDADLEYDPLELHSVVGPIQRGIADVVYGSRFLVRKEARVLYFAHYIANRFITTLSNIFTNLNMTDIETGYKAFRTPIIRNLILTSSGFGMEVEITAQISKLPIRIYEVPISYYGRTYEEGKKIGTIDGIMAIFYIFYYNTIGAMIPRARLYRKKVLSELNTQK